MPGSVGPIPAILAERALLGRHEAVALLLALALALGVFPLGAAWGTLGTLGCGSGMSFRAIIRELLA